MNYKLLFIFFCLLLSSISYCQIKIGDNPQNISASSVLELESTSRAFVLTRINTIQMNDITPLQGALIYNTDSKCVHYYDGTQWLNLCDALTNSGNISLVDNGDGTYTFSDANSTITQINNLNESLEVEDGNLILTDSAGNTVSVELQNLNAQTFTTDPIINTFPTIFITQDASGANFNFEVGIINGENIQDGSIKQADLAGSSVGSAQLRDNSVRNVAIADDAIGSPEIINGSIQPIDIGPGMNNQLLTTNSAGTVQWIDKIGLVSADDVSYDNASSSLSTTNVQDALDEVDNNLNNLTLGDVLTQGNDAGSQLIRNVLDPSSPQDVATRNYVDTEILSSNQVIVSRDIGNVITASASDGGAFYDDATLQSNIATNISNISSNDTDIANNTTAIATKEDAANKSSDDTFTAADNVNFPTQLAVKTYVDNEITASNQTIVSTDTNNVIAAGTDGGAFYDDSTIQSSIANNTANISANDIDIDSNTTSIATKEDAANKSDNTALGNSATLFPTQNAVKTYVDNEITAANQTIVSIDANNVIAAGADGGAFYDDSTIQSNIATNSADISSNITDIANNTAAISTKEDAANKSSEDTFAAADNVQFPTQLAVKTYVDNSVASSNILANANIYVGDAANTAQPVALSGDASISNSGVLSIVNDAVDNTKIADNAVHTENILNESILSEDIQNGTIATEDIANASVTSQKIEPSITNGQILKTVSGAATWANQFHAIGKMNENVPSSNSINIASVVDLGLGNYQIIFTVDADNFDYVIQLTLGIGLGREIHVTNQAITGFTVQISDSNGVAVDSGWYFTIFDF